MPEARLARTRKAYVEAPKWRGMHENTAERLKRRATEVRPGVFVAERSTSIFLRDRDLGDETPWAV